MPGGGFFVRRGAQLASIVAHPLYKTGMDLRPSRIDLPALGLPALLAAGGLYAAHALDLVHGGAYHPQQIEPGEWLLLAASLPLVAGWSVLHRYNMRARERAAQERAELLGQHDPLTGLGHRRAAEEHLALLLAEPLAAGTRIAVLMLELDDFHGIGSRLGSTAADALLKVVARRLEASVRVTDLVARVEGDRFLVLLPEVDGTVAAEAIARRICVAIEAPIEAMGARHVLRASIGLALQQRDGVCAATLLRRAEAALDAAKAEGAGSWRFYEPEAALAD